MKKEPKVKIIPHKKGDKKLAKVMQVLFDKDFKKYEGVVGEIIAIQTYFFVAYGRELPKHLFDNLMQEIFKLESHAKDK